MGEGQVSGFEGWGPWLREGRAGLQRPGCWMGSLGTSSDYKKYQIQVSTITDYKTSD